jgi:alpha,alpha-trehalose phosphorylase
VCIQSILAAEIGYLDKALKYFDFAVSMDLGDVAGNVKDGAHIASTGGTWMAAVYGFGGFRDYDGEFGFRPRLPSQWDRLRYPLTLRGQRLEVDIIHAATTYTLLKGEGLTIRHEDQMLALTPDEPVSVANKPVEHP